MSGPAAAVAPPPAMSVEERVLENQGLVHQVARFYRGRGVEFDDLVQFGNLGLIRAAEKFEPARGFRFTTYAVAWIRQSISRGIDDTSAAMRVPAGTRLRARGHIRAWRTLAAGRVSPPTDDEVFDAAGVPAPLRPLILQGVHAVRARRVEDEGEVVRHQPARPGSPADSLAGDEEREQLGYALALLDDETRACLGLLYGLDGDPPLPTNVVARRLGLAWHAVARKHEAGLATLGRHLGPREGDGR